MIISYKDDTDNIHFNVNVRIIYRNGWPFRLIDRSLYGVRFSGMPFKDGCKYSTQVLINEIKRK